MIILAYLLGPVVYYLFCYLIFLYWKREWRSNVSTFLVCISLFPILSHFIYILFVFYLCIIVNIVIMFVCLFFPLLLSMTVCLLPYLWIFCFIFLHFRFAWFDRSIHYQIYYLVHWRIFIELADCALFDFVTFCNYSSKPWLAAYSSSLFRLVHFYDGIFMAKASTILYIMTLSPDYIFFRHLVLSSWFCITYRWYYVRVWHFKLIFAMIYTFSYMFSYKYYIIQNSGRLILKACMC